MLSFGIVILILPIVKPQNLKCLFPTISIKIIPPIKFNFTCYSFHVNLMDVKREIMNLSFSVLYIHFHI